MNRTRLLFFSLIFGTLFLLGEVFSSPAAWAAQTTPSVEKKKAAALQKARARILAKSKSVPKKKTTSTAQNRTKVKATTVRTNKSSPTVRKNTSPAAKKTQPSDAVKKKTSLEKQQRTLKTQLSSIKQEIALKQSHAQSAEDALKESEKAISKSNRSLKELAEKKTATTAQLADLKTEAKIVGLQVNEAEDVVSSIGQAQFLNSMRHPWQTAITGGNPNELSRRSAILSYLAQEQNRTINRLEHRQRNIEAVALRTEATRKELLRIESEERHNREDLEKEKNSRTVALNRLKKEIKTQKERYEQLVKNDRELSVLITQIDQQIAAAEKRRKEQLAAEKQRLASTKKATGKASGATAGRHLASAPVQGNFGALKGRLTMPVSGTIAATFGQRREGAASALPWRGLLIRAKAGQNVRATAPGTVVFSDWMRGFGNLMILDHGSNYLSVYANNEALFKSVGDSVRQGDTIASVGNSGGEEHPGLYFELRYKGKPFDPARWLAH